MSNYESTPKTCPNLLKMELYQNQLTNLIEKRYPFSLRWHFARIEKASSIKYPLTYVDPSIIMLPEIQTHLM